VSRDRQQYRVEVEVDLGGARREQERSHLDEPSIETPFCIALVGDFSARASRGVVETGRALAARRPLRVDRDNVDELIARVAPELHTTAGGSGGPPIVAFAGLEDFHPDRLYARLPRFRALEDTPARAARAPASASDIRRERTRESGRAAASRGAAPASLLDQILGDAPLPPGGAAALPSRAEPPTSAAGAGARGAGGSDPVAEFARRAVAPYVVRDTSPADAELVAETEATIAAEMRALLHDPAFQALESAWRAVDFLVRRLETDTTLHVYLVDVSKDELAADLAGDTDVESTGTYRLLAESSVGTPGAPRWGLLIGLFTFGAEDDDVALLGRLADVARAAGAPWVAAAHPRLVGSPSFGTAPDPDDWTGEALPAWNALRRRPRARYVGLAAPRFLLRLPYGRDGEPTELRGFEELSGSHAHEEYLWGNGAVLCALLHGEAFSRDGWALRPRLDVGGLPLHLIRADGDVTAKPCAEALLSDRAVARILDRGVMALRSLKDGDAVRIARIQSIAEPLASLAGRWDA
jgi:type VI secretion system protein ImpC